MSSKSLKTDEYQNISCHKWEWKYTFIFFCKRENYYYLIFESWISICLHPITEVEVEDVDNKEHYAIAGCCITAERVTRVVK